MSGKVKLVKSGGQVISKMELLGEMELHRGD